MTIPGWFLLLEKNLISPRSYTIRAVEELSSSIQTNQVFNSTQVIIWMDRWLVPQGYLILSGQACAWNLSFILIVQTNKRTRGGTIVSFALEKHTRMYRSTNSL